MASHNSMDAPIRPGEFDDSRIDPHMVKRLFQAVINQVIRDACGSRKPIGMAVKRLDVHSDAEHVQRRRRIMRKRCRASKALLVSSRHWLIDGGDGFELVVECSGYNPEHVREQCMVIRDRGWKLVSNEL